MSEGILVCFIVLAFLAGLAIGEGHGYANGVIDAIKRSPRHD